MEAKYNVNGTVFGKWSGFSGPEIISSYKTHIHGLEALVKLFEELLHRAEKAEGELENCKTERDKAYSGLEQLRGEKQMIEEGVKRERTEFLEKEIRYSREISRLQGESKIMEEKRDAACAERDSARRDKERILEEAEIERMDNEKEIKGWRESFERSEEQRKTACIELDKLREEKERIVTEFESERKGYRDREARSSEEISKWKERFESSEKACNTLRIDLNEARTIAEKEREKASHSAKTIHELREQIEVLKRNWKTANESEKHAHKEVEKARKEARKADQEREELKAKLLKAEETIRKLQEEQKHESASDGAQELLTCQAQLAECTKHLNTYLSIMAERSKTTRKH